jgi:hypothetical protein
VASDRTIETGLAIEAAQLLGRWTLVAKRHADGCSCCPGGMGNVSMGTVERSVLDWLRQSHPILERHEDVLGLLRECIERKPGLPDDALAALFRDLGSAIDHLELRQAGMG